MLGDERTRALRENGNLALNVGDVVLGVLEIDELDGDDVRFVRSSALNTSPVAPRPTRVRRA